VYFDNHRQPVYGTVPEVLEEGGEITIMEVLRHGKWIRADLRSRRKIAGLPRRYRTIRIKARPHTRPAMIYELPQLPAMFRNTVR